MKIKFGAIIVAERGKVDGHVVSRNSSGDYFCTKATLTSPRSERQVEVRAEFASVSSGWITLITA